MSDATFVKDLLIRPSAVRKGDFVLELTQGVKSPQQTAADYVVTPSIVDAFDRGLGLVGAALHDKRSKGAYLHGSFGSGKSHFHGHAELAAAWRRARLGQARAARPAR